MPQSVPTHRPSFLPTKQERDRYYQRIRKDKDEQRFYHSARWLKFKEVMLTENPYCEECLEQGRHTPAEVVHHIKALKDEPEIALDATNLRCLCRSCHSRLHAT